MANEDVDIKKMLQALTLLPTKLRNEYEKAISKKLPKLPREGCISELFLHLNPLFTFLEYSLLEYIINVFGSNGLKTKMQSYVHEISSFMKKTTVQQLIDYWPPQGRSTPNASKITAQIKKNADSCSLQELNSLRRKICISVRLSDVISAAVSVKNSTSFIISWSLPSVLAPHVITSINKIEEHFFETENMELLFVGDVKVYPRLKLSENKETSVIAMHQKAIVVRERKEHNLTSFASDLKKRYQVIHITISPSRLMDSPIKKLFKLAIIHKNQLQDGQAIDDFVQQTMSGKVDDILNEKEPTELENIFEAENGDSHLIVLIEGAPSSGKSSLAIHICQKWGNGELFEEFTLVILVQLGDPAVQKAQSISDLLPCQDVSVANKLDSELVATKGRGVLWILDGWDELPPNLQQVSIFRRLMVPIKLYAWRSPERLLNDSSVLVTCRSISSSDLHLVASSRIEVLGFSPEEQTQYFTECLEGDTEALEDLLEKIQDNTIVQSSCYIPLNAALTLHHFRFKGHSLPNTEFEMFATVIFSCIKHHLELEGKDHDLPVELKSLGDLLSSKAVGKHFKTLCELAYNGVMQHKVTFSPSDLPEGSSTLGLLHQIDSFLEGGKSMFYRFFHHSLLEVLAAMHIATCLSDSEQASQFQQLFDQPNFFGVIGFYSAITKLKSSGMDKVIKKIVAGSSKRHLITLFNNLYEVHDLFLCQFVASYVDLLNVHGVSLSPLDCLSLGYFISMTCSDKKKTALLDSCKIGDYGIKYLTKYMCDSSRLKLNTQERNLSDTSGWSLDLQNNYIHEDGAASIAKVLQCDSSVITSLNLNSNPIGGKGLQSISEALITNMSLVELDLHHCSLVMSEENGQVVTEMLCKNKSLRRLDLSYNSGVSETGLYYILEGLTNNSTLKELRMSDITSQGGKSLATVIATSTSIALVRLNIDNIEITKDSGPAFIYMLQKTCSLEHISFNFSPRISDVGVSFIAEGLQNNVTLKSLSLIRCNITSSGAKCLAEMLKVNSSLEKLDISENPIEDGEAQFAEALKQKVKFNFVMRDSSRTLGGATSPAKEPKQIQDQQRNIALTEKRVKPVLDTAFSTSVKTSSYNPLWQESGDTDGEETSKYVVKVQTFCHDIATLIIIVLK